MNLFIVLRHLILPFRALSERRRDLQQQRLRELSLQQLPPHLRDDVLDQERHWRLD